MQNVAVRLYDLIGREAVSASRVVAQSNEETNINFDVSRLASGVYFARVVVGNHPAVWKRFLVWRMP